MFVAVLIHHVTAPFGLYSQRFPYDTNQLMVREFSAPTYEIKPNTQAEYMHLRVFYQKLICHTVRLGKSMLSLSIRVSIHSNTANIKLLCHTCGFQQKPINMIDRFFALSSTTSPIFIAFYL